MIYNIVGRDAGAFDLDSSTGQILVKDALDYETKSSYSVTVAVDDGVINPVHTRKFKYSTWDDSIAVAISVANVDEPVIVTLDTETPQVGSELTARLLDPDGGVTGVTWAWERSEDGMT